MVIVNDLSYELLPFCLNHSETFQIRPKQDTQAKIREASAFFPGGNGASLLET